MGEILLFKPRLPDYKSFDKQELLEEMVKFQEERSLKGSLTLDMINRGIPLFLRLEETAETYELKLLCRSYRKHLEIEKQEMEK